MLLLMLLASGLHAQKADVSYLSGISPPQQVLTDIQGSDFYDTYARKSVALFFLNRVIEVHGLTRPFTKEEEAFKKQLTAANKSLAKEWEKTGISFDDPVYKKQTELYSKYIGDKEFEDYVLNRFLTKSTRNYFERVTNEYNDNFQKKSDAADAWRDKENKKRIAKQERGLAATKTIVTILSVPAYLIGFLLIFLARGSIRRNKKLIYLDEQDPVILHSGNNIIKIGYYTGRVVESKSMKSIVDTETTRTNAYNQRTVSHSYSESHHEEFYMECNDVQERAIHLVNSGIQVRKGSIISAAYTGHPDYAARNGFLYYNHQLDQRTILSLGHLFNNSGIGAFIWLFVLSILCALKLYMAKTAFSEYFSLWWYFSIELVQLAVAVLAMVIIPLKIRGRNSGMRAVFVAKGIPRIVELFKEQAAQFKANRLE